MFRIVALSIIRSLALYTAMYPSWYRQQAVSKPLWNIPLLCVQCYTPDEEQRNSPKHVEFYSKNKFEKSVHLVGFIVWIYHDARSAERQISLDLLTLNLETAFSSKRLSPNTILRIGESQKTKIWIMKIVGQSDRLWRTKGVTRIEILRWRDWNCTFQCTRSVLKTQWRFCYQLIVCHARYRKAVAIVTSITCGQHRGFTWRVLESWVLGKTLGSKRGDVTGDWRKLLTKDIDNIMRTVEWQCEIDMACRVRRKECLLGKREGKRPFGRSRHRGG